MSSIENIGQALSRDVQHLATISHNVANVNTPGYMQRTSFDQSIAQSASYQEVAIQSDTGPIRDTQRALDLAIKGPGFFVLSYKDSTVLSRNGRFHINADGFLAHTSGALLLGLDGPIRVTGTDVHIDADGKVRDNTGPVGQIRLDTTAELIPVDAGFYAATSSQPALNSKVQAFALNASTVNPGTETVRMMELSRHLQSLQKAAQTYDQMLQNGINELGKSK